MRVMFYLSVLITMLLQDAKKVEQVYSDPVQRLVADCLLMNKDTAVVSDRKGNISVLSSSHHSGGELFPLVHFNILDLSM